MRMWCLAALIGVGASSGPALGASQAGSCTGGRAICEAVCTPERLSRYYQGSLALCTASCEPRWQQCLRTGTWVHLEDSYPGWHERVSRY